MQTAHPQTQGVVPASNNCLSCQEDKQARASPWLAASASDSLSSISTLSSSPQSGAEIRLNHFTGLPKHRSSWDATPMHEAEEVLTAGEPFTSPHPQPTGVQIPPSHTYPSQPANSLPYVNYLIHAQAVSIDLSRNPASIGGTGKEIKT